MTNLGSGRIEGTRQEVLNILRRRGGGVSVEELARELGLTGATVRRHLDVLLRDDLVSVSQARGRTGRPRYLFTLTEAGEELFPHHYVRLTHRLLEEIVALAPDETAGRGGDAIADLVFGKMAERLADDYAPLVSGTTLEERSRSAATLLRQDGLDFDVVVTEEGVRLLGRGCPCTRIGEGTAPYRACPHDRRLLERVLGVGVRALHPDEIPYNFRSGYAVGEAAAPGGGA